MCVNTTTNHQMQSSVDGFVNRFVPLGGNVMSYASIHLDGRRARLDISPSHPRSDVFFAIDERGLTDIRDD